jgi:O-antigen/teichoic acid export membrane protein
MGVGTVLRLVSDVHGAVLQSHQRIARDNTIQALADLAWVALCVAPFGFTIDGAAYAYLTSSGLLLAARWRAARDCMSTLPEARYVNWASLRELLGFGVLVSCAQLADFLYAPTDFILINRLLGPLEVATYAPAVQIDAAMLVLVSGLAAVLLPRGAAAHAHGQYARLRMYYVRGTLVSAAILAASAVVVWAGSPWIFELWLGDSMPPTRAILPLVLVHTVVGGSSAVGRSILLGMGKVKPFTISVLLAGVGNVLLSYVFVRYMGLGLPGIVLGTIIAVTARCAIWTPWYVLRALPRR